MSHRKRRKGGKKQKAEDRRLHRAERRLLAGIALLGALSTFVASLLALIRG
jgi:hypothetical protein